MKIIVGNVRPVCEQNYTQNANGRAKFQLAIYGRIAMAEGSDFLKEIQNRLGFVDRKIKLHEFALETFCL